MSFNVVSGGVVRHISYCTLLGQTAVVKRDWQCTLITGGSNIDSGSILADFALAMSGFLKDLMTEDALYYGAQLYYQTPVGPKPRPESSIAHQGPGNEAAHALPTQDCLLLSLYTDILGKTGQGRTYTPFPSTNFLGIDAHPDPVVVVPRLDNLGDFLLAPRIVTNGGISATFRCSLYVPGGAPPKPFTSYISRTAWATQRKRGDYGRLNKAPF